MPLPLPHPDETERLIAEERKKWPEATTKSAIQWLMNQESKYTDLVWFARRPAGESSDQKALVEEKFPDECDNLRSESGDFHHGFNSGMLAASRFLSMAHTDPQFAMHYFPDLDT